MIARHNHLLTESQIKWLWPRYQRCTFPVASFPKRFARNDIDRLTEDGRRMACDLAYQYRRQIFGQRAAKWSFEEFVCRVESAAAANV